MLSSVHFHMLKVIYYVSVQLFSLASIYHIVSHLVKLGLAHYNESFILCRS